ncbi:hypothetical protein HanRHA438_Chr17g0841401 [Helianthus annuus]|nr:hypothetical protein HanIR_Chr17g0902381 [Helianthus annuus]KAJ0828806.1 hypothetical protein HanRHA438_Chr17g0841401 [Helianthus annuus]
MFFSNKNYICAAFQVHIYTCIFKYASLLFVGRMRPRAKLFRGSGVEWFENQESWFKPPVILMFLVGLEIRGLDIL